MHTCIYMACCGPVSFGQACSLLAKPYILDGGRDIADLLLLALKREKPHMCLQSAVAFSSIISCCSISLAVSYGASLHRLLTLILLLCIGSRAGKLRGGWIGCVNALMPGCLCLIAPLALHLMSEIV